MEKPIVSTRVLKQALLLAGSAGVAHAVITLPVGIYSDAQWQTVDQVSSNPDAIYQVEADNLDVTNERWELPVYGGEWSIVNDGGTDYIRTNSGGSGGYYAYGDLTQVELTQDEANDQWKIRYSVAGDFDVPTDKKVSDASVGGLKANYYIYFGSGNEHYAFEVNGPGTSSGSVTAKIFEPENNGTASVDTPFGTSITTTGESSDGFKTEVSSGGSISAFSYYDPGNDVYDLEIIYDYDQGPISKAFLENLDYYYIGTAVSNPSSPADLFVNDQFNDPLGQSVEYDSLWIQDPQNPLNNDNYEGPNQEGQGPEVPEPSAYALLLGLAAISLSAARRRAQK